jgi:hypothetical protein
VEFYQQFGSGINILDRYWRHIHEIRQNLNLPEANMTQQEAYIKLNEILARMQELDVEASSLAMEHKLVLVSRSRDGVPETLNPDWLDPTTKYPTFRKDLPDEALLQFHDEYCGCSKGLDCEEIEEIKDSYAGRDIYDCWVPSQLC